MPKGDRTMLRKLLLPMLATAVLAGCATDYRYRGGNGDYYYGQPRVEYRYIGPSGYYGSGYYGEWGLGYGFGGYGYGATYYYDSFGRLVYGYPGRYRYGNDWYRSPRPHRGHGGRDDHDDDADNDHDRRPPWRDLGRLQQGDDEGRAYRNRDDNPERRQRPIQRQQSPADASRQQRPAPTAPIIRERRERSEPSSQMGGFRGTGGRVQGKRNGRTDD